ncbi:MAG: TIGR03960 family B12-binding radical SAM protein [Planctomycetaceae bacterium]|nr:TIGR03960 family B12-binding radical SAM protein [Planctomycetaceae bacterium]
MPKARDQRLRELAPVLARVAGPGQYVGGEHNEITKPDAQVRLALAFADVYAVGMSHHGIRILYEIVNARDGMAAERVFAPFPDMEAALRDRAMRLTTLETATPLNECHAIGFSLSYELAATSVLTMLDLGGVPLTRFERENTAAPLVIAGGAASMNTEPLSDFIDVFLIGEGEESLPELMEILREFQPLTGEERLPLLRRIAREVRGAYVPQLYRTETLADGSVVVVGGIDAEIPYPVERRLAENFATATQARKLVVPIHETVHERAVLEIMRGCPNGCRFCQAGYATRPQRERTPADLLAAAKDCLAATGYDEVGLLSLSTSNYSRFDELLELLDGEFAPKGISLSLPSLRVDHALSGIPARVQSVRKSGLTVAPEAGSERLRAVINKDVKDEVLLEAAAEAFQRGWRQVKLYFMLGLPTETDEDAEAIVALSHAVSRQRGGGGGRGKGKGGGGGRPAVHLSVSNYVPKPFTAFQWCGAAHPDVWAARQRIVRDGCDRRLVAYHGHDVSTSMLEAVFSRGDRRLGGVVLAAYRAGARLDAWSEHFRPDLWNEAFSSVGLDLVALATREIPLDQALPWGHIDSGMRDGFLRLEYERALAGTRTPACGPGSCAGCGVTACEFA